MKISDSMLKSIMPTCPKAKRDAILPVLNKTCVDYNITNELRFCAFIATLAQESGEFKWFEELASGNDYDTRTDLGNTPQVDGDGKLYKGRGAIQITGTDNYVSYTKYLRDNKHLPFVDFVKFPKRLAELPYAIDSAAWFFAVHIHANPLADQRQFLAIQVRVNGRNRKTGLPNHWDLRKGYYERALRVCPDNLFIDIETPDELPDTLHADYLTNTPVDADSDGNTVTGDLNATMGNDTQKVEVSDGSIKVETSTGSSLSESNVAIVKQPSPLKDLWKKITGFVLGNGAIDTATEKLGQVQAWGLPMSFWKNLLYLALAGCVIYLIYIFYRHFQQKQTEKHLIEANKTSNNIVTVIDSANIPDFQNKGFTIVST